MVKLRIFTSLALVLVLVAPSAQAVDIMAADLAPNTRDAFDYYVKLTEARVDQEVKRPAAFLYLDGLPEPQRSQIRSSLRNGEVYMDRMQTRDPAGSALAAPDALIHHWIGAVFIPGANLHQVLSVVQDYDRHQEIYQPEVVRSKLIRHDGNDFQIFYRLRERKVITVTLDTNHDVNYFPIDAHHCRSRSASTRIAEVANAGEPGEYEKPVGHDGGFLWRMNSDWRFEEQDGGVYVEVEAISLTRDIPTGLGWIVKPFVTSIPRESLLDTLGSTRTAVEARVRTTAQR
jgi:hypothetical protein